MTYLRMALVPQGVKAAAVPSDPWRRPADAPDVRSKHIILANYGTLPEGVLGMLLHMSPSNGKVTVIAETEVNDPRQQSHAEPQNGAEQAACAFEWCQGHPSAAKTLRSAGVAQADALVVAGIDDWTDEEADMQVRCLADRYSIHFDISKVSAAKQLQWPCAAQTHAFWCASGAAWHVAQHHGT